RNTFSGESNEAWFHTREHTLSQLRYDPAADSIAVKNFELARTRPEGNVRAITAGPENRMYMASSSHIAYLDTEVSSPARARPALHFTGVTAETDSLLLHGWTPATLPELELPYEKNSLRFNWSLVSFTPPEFNRYQFRMAGISDTWSEWSEEQFADYRNLREGRYTFEVRGRDLYGQVSAPRHVSITIAPPWFRSAPARIAYMLIAIVLLGAAFRWRTQRLLERQHQLEQQVRQRTREIEDQKKELERLDSVKTRFFANISHEFRTPLTLIKGPAQQLSDGRLPPENLSEAAGVIITNADRLLAMIEEVLQFTKLETGRLKLEVRLLQFSTLVRRVAGWYRGLADEKGLDMRVEVQEAAGNLRIYADARQMELLCSNLLSNAIKYTAQGQVLIRLFIQNGQLCLEVEDTGAGIAQEELTRIFDRYYRGSSTRISSSGSGIGLDLVRFVARMHGLELNVDSEPGQGTRITIGIPGTLEALTGDYVLLQDDDTPETAPMPSPRLHQPPPSPPETAAESLPLILIIDDHAGIRAFIRSVLSDEFRFLEAADGLNGFAKAAEAQPDIILSDVMMPGMDGISLSQKLKKSWSTAHIPLLLITAKSGEANELSGLEAGANDYITKPFSPDILRARVEGQLALRRQLRKHLLQQAPATFPSAVENPPEPASGQADTFLKQVQHEIRQQLSNPDFGVDQLAQRMNKSTSALYRQLKKSTALSAKDLIRRERMARARQLLDRQEGNITEVAYAVGYNSLSYFSRVFREAYGMAPSDYAERRAQHQT
ncbi:MAG: ATP-binding protein, partial [Cyclonatronaceae bacterium]